MELRHLRYFMTVAEELNFTKAARLLDVSQPVLSRQISNLEREMGVRLFDRNSSRVFLTDAGSRFLSEARVVLQHASQAVAVAKQVHAGGSGTLRVGIGKGLGDIVSRIISGYLRISPALEIDVRDVASGFQGEAFDDRKIDVGFMRPSVGNLHLASKLLFEERVSAVLRRGNPLAKRASVRLKDLAQQNLLMIEKRISPGFNEKVLQLYRSAGLTPKIIPTETMPYEESGAILVESGKGIYLAVGEKPYHPAFADRLVAIPLSEPDAVIPVHVVWRKNEKAKTTLEFVRYAESFFVSHQKHAHLKDQRGGNSRRPKSLKCRKR